MTVYQFLLELDESGYLKPLIRKGVVAPHVLQWMEIKKIQLEHPNASLCEISYHVQGTKTTIFRALQFMNQLLI